MTGSLPPNQPENGPDHPDDPGIAGSVTGEWVEVYQPDGAPEPTPASPTTTGTRNTVMAIILFVATLLLVIVGSVTPLFTASIPLFTSGVADPATNPGPADVLSADAWQLSTADNSLNVAAAPRVTAMPVPIGYPLVLAALLLVITIALWLRAGQRPSSAGVARPVGLAAATFLTGLVIALGMFELAWSRFGSSSTFGGLGTAVGMGYWTLLAAAAVGLVAAILAYRVPAAEPAPEEPVDWSPSPSPDSEVPPGQPAEWPVVAVIPTDERTDW